MRKEMYTSHQPNSVKVWVPEAVKLLPTIELIVDHILQPLQSLKDGLPVHQVWNFAIPGSQSLVRDAPDLDELLGSVLDPAVDWEQDNPHKHQDVDGQQSFDFACHSHERGDWVWTPVKPSNCPCTVACFVTLFLECVRVEFVRGGEKVNLQRSWRRPVQHHGQLGSLFAPLQRGSAGVTWRVGALLTRLTDTELHTLASATYYERKTTPCNLQMQHISPKQRDKPRVS